MTLSRLRWLSALTMIAMVAGGLTSCTRATGPRAPATPPSRDASAEAAADTIRATGDAEFDLPGGWVAGGQPSERRVRQVASAGLSVISLRTAEEREGFDEAAAVSAAGGRFLRVETRGADLEDPAFRARLFDVLDAEAAAGRRVYLHCASSNRVGASWALYRHERGGAAPSEALEAGRAAGLRSLEPQVRATLGLD